MMIRPSSIRHPASEVLSDGLLQQVFRMYSHERGTGLVVALTAVDRQSGVSFITQALAEELGNDNGGSVVCLDSRTLIEIGTLYVEDALSRTAISGSTLAAGDEAAITPWCDSYSQRKAILEQLRSRYQYTLVDCPSLNESPDILGIADLVDGVVLVIEANRTQARQIAVLEQTIQAVGGTIFGNVLNKRAYFIPDWLYSLLGKFSI
jgi:hypothetical protein